jgi:hypothetical protein
MAMTAVSAVATFHPAWPDDAVPDDDGPGDEKGPEGADPCDG